MDADKTSSSTDQFPTQHSGVHRDAALDRDVLSMLPTSV